MPKRRYPEETREERWQRKFTRYEAKLKRRRSRVLYSDEEEPYEENREYTDNGYYYQESEPLEEMDLAPRDPPIPIAPLAVDSPVVAPPLVAAPTVVPTAILPSVTEPIAGTVKTAEIVAAPSSEAPASTTDSAKVAASDIDPELLVALGSLEDETIEWGDPILDEIAVRLNPLLLNGFKKEDRERVLKKYLFPENITLLKAPTLNAEIAAMLTEQSRNRDKRMFTKQNQLGSALSAVTRAMSLLMNKGSKTPEILSILSDASKILADSHYSETDTRRSLVIPLVDKGLIIPFKGRKRDGYLFGDNLGEMVKNSRGIKKTGQLIQATPSTSNLNSRGPPSQGRNTQRSYVNRGGSQQRSHAYTYRRRPTPYAPPLSAPARRPPPPRRPPHAAAAPRSAPPATDRTATPR